MSERPVPRRESPWGTPEGEHRQPKAHRCNDRAEDVIQVPSFSPQFNYFSYLTSTSFIFYIFLINSAISVSDFNLIDTIV